MAKAGATLEEILQKLEEVKSQDGAIHRRINLENLVKGGRIGRVTGLISSLLNIRVVMQMTNHTLTPIVKGRGAKTFKKWLDDLKESLKEKEIEEIGISYAGGPEFANQMKVELQEFVENQSLS